MGKYERKISPELESLMNELTEKRKDTHLLTEDIAYLVNVSGCTIRNFDMKNRRPHAGMVFRLIRELAGDDARGIFERYRSIQKNRKPIQKEEIRKDDEARRSSYISGGF